MNKSTKDWYNNSYKTAGFAAQRLYPNEELLRFMGRNYFKLGVKERGETKILEVGCGSCANLWMIANEGFDAYGLDISSESLKLGEKMLEKWGVSATLKCESMTELTYENNYFDSVLDVFSGFCLNMLEFDQFLSKTNTILKPNGKLFLYTPSANSMAFKNFEPATNVDDLTLNGIYRKDSPYFGNFYNCRFETIEHLTESLQKNGFKINYFETVVRSYNNNTELYEFIIIEAEKI